MTVVSGDDVARGLSCQEKNDCLGSDLQNHKSNNLSFAHVPPEILRLKSGWQFNGTLNGALECIVSFVYSI